MQEDKADGEDDESTLVDIGADTFVVCSEIDLARGVKFVEWMNVNKGLDHIAMQNLQYDGK